MNNYIQYSKFVVLINISLLLFILGNLVYSPILNFPWYISSILSEFIFVLMYTVLDCGNIRYRYKFALIHIILLLIFYVPTFAFLFYSTLVQYFSVSIAILAILVNSQILNFLYSKGIKKILCSRVSTILASIVDILLFSFLLNIGLKGAVLMAILRLIYIILISRMFFKK